MSYAEWLKDSQYMRELKPKIEAAGLNWMLISMAAHLAYQAGRLSAYTSVNKRLREDGHA